MKRLDLGMIGGALLTLMMVVVLTGCNDDDKHDMFDAEQGEPLVVVEQVVMECDQPFAFKAGGKFIDTNVSVEYNETKEAYTNEFGIDIGYTVVTPCPAEVVEGPIVPVDGVCPTGFVISDCNANECLPVVCDEGSTLGEDGECTKDLTCDEGLVIDDNNTCVIPVHECAEGTEYNETTELCEVIPPLECLKGDINIDEVCTPLIYKRDGEDCLEGYVEGPKGYLCWLESELDK